MVALGSVNTAANMEVRRAGMPRRLTWTFLINLNRAASEDKLQFIVQWWCLHGHKKWSFEKDTEGKNCKSVKCKTLNNSATLWNWPWWAVIAIQPFHLLHTFMSLRWVLNHGDSWSPKRPFRCPIPDRRPPKLQNFGIWEGPPVCPIKSSCPIPISI